MFKNFITSSVILLIVILPSCSTPNKTPSKPNVIVILADDLGYAGLSCFGGEGISTPHLDKLAENGVKCTNFYANSTVCSPTRVALLSGRYQQRVGLDHIYFHCVDSVGFDPKTNPSLPVILKENGYKTGVFGKWHLGSGKNYQPRAHGFDDFVGFLDGNIDFISKHNTESEVDWFVHHEPSNEKGYVTHLLNDAVVDFIEREKDNPFFIYLPEAAVHVPMQGPNDPPLRTDDFYTYKVDHKFPKDEYMRRYAEMITAMDNGVGKIVESLKKHKLLENTLIIFSSDNGGEPTGVKYGKVNGKHRGHKGDMYEGGIKVPTLFYWKGKLQPQVNSQTMLTMDIFPTIMDIANIPYKTNSAPDGVSVWNSLSANTPLEPRDIFWMHRERLVYRHGDLKLIWQNGNNELYDLAKDPLETTDLKNLPEYQDILADMIKTGEEWHKNTATGFPKQRELGVRVNTPWPCKRDLKLFNNNKSYHWINNEAVIK
ncbi:sulfatase [Labilibacter sediminis]|nr:sulfatase [Labilibacter sediminis]